MVLLLAASITLQNALLAMIGSGVAGSIIALSVTTLVDYMRARKTTNKLGVDWRMGAPLNSKDLMLPTENIMLNNAVTALFTNVLKYTNGGIFLIGAPPGSGKTTIMVQAIKDFMAESRRPVMYVRQAMMLTAAGFKEKIGIRYLDDISEYVPKGSIFVIDQIETDALTDEMKSFILELANESKNTEAFHVVMIISSSHTFRSVMSMDPGEKIESSFSSNLMKWSEDNIRSLARGILRHWTAEDTDEVVRVLHDSYSPGLVNAWCTKLKSKTGWNQIPEHIRQAMARAVQNKVELWTDFAAASDNSHLIE